MTPEQEAPAALLVEVAVTEETKARIDRVVDRAQHLVDGRGRVFKLLWAVAGAIVVLAGLAMTVFPGPAIVVLPVGLAMLAAEFAWARRLLTASVDRGLALERRLARISPLVKVLVVVVVLAALVAAVVYASW